MGKVKNKAFVIVLLVVGCAVALAQDNATRRWKIQRPSQIKLLRRLNQDAKRLEQDYAAIQQEIATVAAEIRSDLAIPPGAKVVPDLDSGELVEVVARGG